VQSEIEQRYQAEHGRLLSVSAAITEIEQMRKEGAFPADVLDSVDEEYKGRAQDAELALRDLHLSGTEKRQQQDRVVKRRLLAAERAALTHAGHIGNISNDVASQLLISVDTEIDLLEQHSKDDDDVTKPPSATGVKSEASAE
jgi:hypothetical protein